MRPLTHVAPAALRQLLRDLPLSDGKVVFAWSVAVGPALARSTAVKLDNGVLVVETTSDQWVREIKRSSGVILPRLRTLLGENAVERIEVRTTPI